MTNHFPPSLLEHQRLDSGTIRKEQLLVLLRSIGYCLGLQIVGFQGAKTCLSHGFQR